MNRRQFLKGLAGIVLTSDTALSCDNLPKQNYSLSDFKDTLEKQNKEYDKSLESYWKISDTNERNRLGDIYTNPEKFFNNLEDKQKKEYLQFWDLKELSEEEKKGLLKPYEDKYPWKIDLENLSFSDKLIICFD